MQNIDFKDAAATLLTSLTQGGVFLVSGDDPNPNVMVLGWGSISYYWGKPVLVAPVRFSRYTYEKIMEKPEFVVCVPKLGEMKKELGILGSRSGRDTNKVIEAEIVFANSAKLTTPIIYNSELVFECKVIAVREFEESAFLNDEIPTKWYKDNDYHKLFIGEIVSCYKVD